MRFFRILLILLLVASVVSGKDKYFGLTLQLSNPVNDVQAGWFNIDGESFDGYSVKNKSFAAGLTIQYCVTKSMQLRLRTGLTRINMLEYGGMSQPSEYDTISVSGKQFKIHLAPGVLWNAAKENFKFFGGFELPYTLQEKYFFSYWRKSADLNSGAITEYTITSAVPTGYSIGIGAIFGFRYDFSNWFSLGAEFSPSINYYSLGGETVSLNSSDPNWSYHTQDKTEGLTGYENRFSLNVIFNLGNKN